MTEKLTGYILLVAGLLIIFFAAFSVFATFNGQNKPYGLFNFEGISIDLDNFVTTTESYTVPEEYAGDLIQNLDQLEIESNSSKNKQEIVSSELLNTTLNYFAYILFMGFIASIGFKVASLGTQLTRPIIIKTSNTNAQTSNNNSQKAQQTKEI